LYNHDATRKVDGNVETINKQLKNEQDIDGINDNWEIFGKFKSEIDSNIDTYSCSLLVHETCLNLSVYMPHKKYGKVIGFVMVKKFFFLIFYFFY
jgi:hypothetical protein